MSNKFSTAYHSGSAYLKNGYEKNEVHGKTFLFTLISLILVALAIGKVFDFYLLPITLACIVTFFNIGTTPDGFLTCLRIGSKTGLIFFEIPKKFNYFFNPFGLFVVTIHNATIMELDATITNARSKDNQVIALLKGGLGIHLISQKNRERIPGVEKSTDSGEENTSAIELLTKNLLTTLKVLTKNIDYNVLETIQELDPEATDILFKTIKDNLVTVIANYGYELDYFQIADVIISSKTAEAAELKEQAKLKNLALEENNRKRNALANEMVLAALLLDLKRGKTGTVESLRKTAREELLQDVKWKIILGMLDPQGNPITNANYPNTEKDVVRFEAKEIELALQAASKISSVPNKNIKGMVLEARKEVKIDDGIKQQYIELGESNNNGIAKGVTAGNLASKAVSN